MLDRLWSKTPRVLYITNDQTDITTVWRCHWPCSELTARGYVADFTSYGQLNMIWNLLERGRYNCVVTPRMGFHTTEQENNWLELVQKLHKMGIQWVCETDDNLFTDTFVERHILMNAPKSYNPGKTERIIRFERESRLRVLQYADAITVSTEYLADIVSPLTSKPVLVTPNGINAELFEYRVNATERLIPPLTLGWSGGPRLEDDLEPLYSVWSTVAKLRPEVHFVMQGWTPPRMLQAMQDAQFTSLSGVEFERHAGMQRNFDIFCCVAKHDDFNLSKSAIKFYEASLAGAACVTSADVYGQANQGGYIAHTHSEWVDALLELIDQPEQRQKTATAAKQRVLENYTLAQTYPTWLDAWASVV